MILFAAALIFLVVALVNCCCWPKIRQLRSTATVSILIPARNEEDNLPNCLLDAVATDAAEILVYNDHSSDGTADVVRRFAAIDERVRLIDPVPLPTDWAGKTFACSRLADAARSEWLLFLDADTSFVSDAPARIAAEAEARGVTLLSCWPGFVMGGFWEKLLMPMLNFVVFSIFPSPLMFKRKEASLGLAHGACLLLQSEAYRRTGGHSQVRGEMFEDTRLAQTWRRIGEQGLCLDGSGLVTVRMYQNFAAIWRGFLKNFYPAFRHPANYWLFIGMHFTVFLLPFIVGAWQAAGVVVATRLALALRFRHPLWSVLLHPLAEVVVLALGLASFWSVVWGHGVTWKGRAYRTT